jgi:hypothetical protein
VPRRRERLDDQSVEGLATQRLEREGSQVDATIPACQKLEVGLQLIDLWRGQREVERRRTVNQAPAKLRPVHFENRET